MRYILILEKYLRLNLFDFIELQKSLREKLTNPSCFYEQKIHKVDFSVFFFHLFKETEEGVDMKKCEYVSKLKTLKYIAIYFYLSKYNYHLQKILSLVGKNNTNYLQLIQRDKVKF